MLLDDYDDRWSGEGRGKERGREQEAEGGGVKE